MDPMDISPVGTVFSQANQTQASSAPAGGTVFDEAEAQVPAASSVPERSLTSQQVSFDINLRVNPLTNSIFTEVISQRGLVVAEIPPQAAGFFSRAFTVDTSIAFSAQT
jgi:hypothetical protein